jgi:uridine kinase
MKSKIIGIAGGSGAGKTTFLKSLFTHFSPEEITIVSQDNYYKTQDLQQPDENGVLNFDLPTAIDEAHFVADMNSLAAGQSITKLEYNFNNPAWEPQPIVVQPAPIIVMEGLFVFHYAAIREQLSYKVFLDAHHATRLQRRLHRDEVERGYPAHEVLYQWDQHVRPAELQYLEPYRSECELIIMNDEDFQEGLQTLVNEIRKMLQD